MHTENKVEVPIEINVGYLVLFSHSGLFDKLVKWFTGSDYSHSGVVYQTGEKIFLIGESWGNGFDIRKRRQKELEKALIKKPVFVINNTEAILNKYIGRKYDRITLIGIIIFRFLGIKIFNNTLNKLTCSEACSRFYHEVTDGKLDLETEFEKPHDFITPKDLSESKYFI